MEESKIKVNKKLKGEGEKLRASKFGSARAEHHKILLIHIGQSDAYRPVGHAEAVS